MRPRARTFAVALGARCRSLLSRGPRGEERRAWPIVLTLALVAGALLPEPALRDAVTHGAPPIDGLALSRPLAYVALAPLCEVLDALTLLSLRQHIALVATVVCALVAWRVTRRFRHPTTRARYDVAAVVLGVLLLALLYALIVAPRPMAGLVVADPEILAVDFHSHTDASWDGRTSFTVERNRAWHRAGGWHAAYVTDHRNLDGAVQAMATNPRHAGDDTVLLPGAEARAKGLMLLVLGVSEAERATFEARGVSESARPPVLRNHPVIITVPVELDSRMHRRRSRFGPIVGLEVMDAGVRGLGQMQRDHDRLVAIARQRDWAPVTGSNTHGWSQTPPAWSLLRLPGWRELTPEALGARIEAQLRQGRFAAVRPVERWAADTGATPLALAATAPAVVWHILATLTLAERLACLAWIWGIALALASLAKLPARARP